MAPLIAWTEERIRQGLEQFKTEHGRYPSAREFDKCAYLPTARQLQRRYKGGLPEFRRVFGLDGPNDFTKGETRSKVAKSSIARSYKYEEEFYNYLISHFSENRVHEQKRIRPGNIASDFFIYHKDSKRLSVVVDVFYAESLYNLTGIVNIKLKRYANLPYKTYFVAIGSNIAQVDIDKLLKNKKVPVPSHITICTETEFKQRIAKFDA